jgi:hypothetical protein
MKSLLLPQSLQSNPGTMKALCDGLFSCPDLAKRFDGAIASTIEGTWTDAWRERFGSGTDLPLALCHAREGESFSDARTIALATPLAASLGLTDLVVLEPEQVRLNEENSRALCEAANAHLAQDGLSLRFVDTHEWLLESTSHIEALTEHPMFIAGEAMRQFLPRGRDARMIERWMNELQMLLFTHPVNAARQANRLPVINVVWLHSFSSPHAPAINSSLPTTLFADALKLGDADAWRSAWGTLESELVQADEVVLGDAFPRLRLTAGGRKKAGLFSWFAKKPMLGEVLMRLQTGSLSRSAGEGGG